jgi:hypothetical protein
MAQHSECTRHLIPGLGHAPGFDVLSGSRRVNMGSGLLASRYRT